MNDLQRIGIAGDWHGNKGWAKYALNQLHSQGVRHVLQLGDFGFWPGNHGQKYLHSVNKTLTELDMILYVTLGNHEDYVQITTFQPHPTMKGWVYNPRYPKILVATRGARWVWEGVSFVSLGGGNSIDYAFRTKWVDWWEAEQITLGDVYETISGGHADVMVAHDCPAGVDIFGSHRTTVGNWSYTDLAYAEKSRVAMRQAVDGVKPQLFLHGHYHLFNDVNSILNDGLEDYALHSIGMNMDATQENLGVLSLPDLTFTLIPVEESEALRYRLRF